MGRPYLSYSYKQARRDLSFTVQVVYRIYDRHNVSIGEVWDEKVAIYIVKLLNENKQPVK